MGKFVEKEALPPLFPQQVQLHGCVKIFYRHRFMRC